MAILGLLNAEQFTAERFKNYRRSVFYYYPNGSAPLIGLLSLMGDEETNDPEYYWYEKIKDDQRTLTAANTTGSFITNTTTNADATSGGFSLAAAATVRVIVVDATKFRVGHIVRMVGVPTTGTAITITGQVLAVYGGAGTSGLTGSGGTKQGLDVRVNEAYANITNSASAVGLEVLIVGIVASEGQVGASLTPWNKPLREGNYTQIMRTAFQFTGTAAKTSATFDKEGPYKDKAKEATINHNQEMEKNFIFGRKYITTDPVTNQPQRFTAGVLWFLEQWELTSSNPYGRLGATADTDDDKRLIANAGGSMSEKTYDNYLERIFRMTTSKTNEKLVLCGSGFLKVMNQLYRSKGVFQTHFGDKNQTYGMSIISHLTVFGELHYRTHPLFSENPTLRFAALFLEVGNLKYRFIKGRDTELLKNRQPNNADYREDEYLSECGLELRAPQSHMFMQNVLDFT